jgi:hypothetical protein
VGGRPQAALCVAISAAAPRSHLLRQGNFKVAPVCDDRGTIASMVSLNFGKALVMSNAIASTPLQEA